MTKVIISTCLFLGISDLFVFNKIDAIANTADMYMPDVGASDGPLSYEEILPSDFNDELECMQNNIFFEARNQNRTAQLSVGWVTINRVMSRKYPNTVCSVVYQGKHNAKGLPYKYKCKFSWYCDGLSDTPNLTNKLEERAWEVAHEVATTLIKSCVYGINPEQCPDDPSEGALYYHSISVDPYWRSSMVQTAQVGDHIFYSPN